MTDENKELNIGQMDSNVSPPLNGVEPDFRRLKLRIKNLSSQDINLLKHSCLCEKVRPVEHGFTEYSLIVDRTQLKRDMREVQRHYRQHKPNFKDKELYKLAIESILSRPSRIDMYRQGTNAGASSSMDNTGQTDDELNAYPSIPILLLLEMMIELNRAIISECREDCLRIEKRMTAFLGEDVLRPVIVEPAKDLQAATFNVSDTQEVDESVDEEIKTMMNELSALKDRAEKLKMKIGFMEERRK